MIWLSSMLQLYAKKGMSAGCSVCALTVRPYYIISILMVYKHYGALSVQPYMSMWGKYFVAMQRLSFSLLLCCTEYTFFKH